jgi:hypothetical protein
MKNYFLSIFVVMCGFTSSCLNFIPNNSGNIPSNSVKTSLDATAKIKAEEVFDKYFTKCGDYWYTHMVSPSGQYYPTYVQLSEVTASVNSNKEFTDADIRNGLEWYGNVTYSSVSVRRMSEKESEPSQWQESYSSFFLFLNKYKNLEWKISGIGKKYEDVYLDYKKPECSQIPQALLK